MHHDEGTLLAYLDGELPAEQRAQIEAHLATCAECSAMTARLAADRDVAARALGALQQPGEVVAMPASAGRRRTATAAPTRTLRWTQVAAAAAAVLVLGSFAFGPVRDAAAGLLQVFRVQKVQTVTLSEADLQSMASALKKGGRVDLKSFGEAWVDGPASSATTVTLAEAQSAVDFPIRLPAGLSDDPELLLHRTQTYKFKLHVSAINAALESYGSTRTLPAALDNQEFSVVVPPIVVARYADRFDGSAASTGVADGGIYVGQARSPEISVPAGVSADELRDVLLNLPFIPQSVRDEIGSVQNWQSTLLIPNVDGTAHDVTINGVAAVVISPKSPTRSLRSKISALPPITDTTAVVWNDNGVVRAIGGHLSESTALALAGTMVK